MCIWLSAVSGQPTGGLQSLNCFVLPQQVLIYGLWAVVFFFVFVCNTPGGTCGRRASPVEVNGYRRGGKVNGRGAVPMQVQLLAGGQAPCPAPPPTDFHSRRASSIGVVTRVAPWAPFMLTP